MTRRRSFIVFLGRVGASLLVALLALILADTAVTKTRPGGGLSQFNDARGYQIFTSRCEACHAREEGDLSRMGPNLGRMGVEAATRRPGLNGPEYILESILDPAAFTTPGASGAMMPANMVADLSDDDIRNLIAHVARLGATPDEEQIAALVVPRDQSNSKGKLVVRRDVLERGERVFRQQCRSCHSVHSGAEHQVFAPPLFGVGFQDERVLRDGIQHTKGPVSERYKSTRVLLTNGSVLVGIIIEQTPDELVLLSTRPENRGEIIAVPLTDVKTKADGKPDLVDVGLPPGLAAAVESLTPDDLDALVSLIRTFQSLN